jgi:hypothetical protein
MTVPAVWMDEAAARHLVASGTTAQHIVEHHRDHLARDCECPFGTDGVTAMVSPDGTVLMISEPEPGIVFITAYSPGWQPEASS